MNLEKSFDTTYPEVDSRSFINLMMQTGQPKGNVENAYIRATRNDDKVGLRRTLCRGEFLEGILRCANDWVKSKHPLHLVSDHIDEYFGLALKPEYDSNCILPLRKLIRKSKQLNQLLYDNREGLTLLW